MSHPQEQSPAAALLNGRTIDFVYSDGSVREGHFEIRFRAGDGRFAEIRDFCSRRLHNDHVTPRFSYAGRYWRGHSSEDIPVVQVLVKDWLFKLTPAAREWIEVRRPLLGKLYYATADERAEIEAQIAGWQ